MKNVNFQIINKNHLIYSYYLSAYDVFINSDECAYIFNFIDTFLNIPSICYEKNINTILLLGQDLDGFKRVIYPFISELIIYLISS